MIQDQLNFWQRTLNESQLQAVEYCDGPLLVIAGAGSGKTRVLTYKIAYLMAERHVSALQILALTFTNKAAREMNSRISEIVNTDDVKYLWSGTFHSIFARILRRECDKIGFDSNFTIYDTTDSKSLLKLIIKEMGLDDKVYKASTVQGRISDAKNRLILPETYAASADIVNHDKANNLGEIHRIYATYFARCKQANAMDFDDLLLYTFLLLRDNPDVQKRYRDRFRYILVDEYQDTNYAQHQIIRLLTTPESSICVVGDDAQSIYAFRGANIDNILNFTQQYPSARTVKLERNYRSTQNIVNAANSIISHNRRQIPKVVYSEKEQGAPLLLMAAGKDYEEAAMVVGEIRRLARYDHVSYSDIAILYRQNALSRSFEIELRKQGVAYRVYGGPSFFDRKEIKDVLAYCRLLCNVHDEEAFRRVVNYPARGIGKTSQDALIAAAHAHGVSLWQVANDPVPYAFNAGRTQGKISQFCMLIEGLREMVETHSAFDIVDEVVKRSGIAADIRASKDPEDLSRQENIEELLADVKKKEQDALEQTGSSFVSLSDYLSQVSLLTDVDEQTDETQERITLMTVHAAKGLEFCVVFLVGMEDDIFPGSQALYPKQMEEERRLFYVAVTRAKERCFISFAGSRYRYGSMESSEPSRFLREVDSRYLQEHVLGGNRFAGGARSASGMRRPDFGQSRPSVSTPQVGRTPSPFNVRRTESASPVAPPSHMRPLSRTASSPRPSATGASSFTIGERVEHERFGKGLVTAVEGAGDDLRISVDFEAVGNKKLLLKFARLTKL